MNEYEIITSTSNSKIKETSKLQQKKYRTQSGLFLLEGYKPIAEAAAANIKIQNVYTTEKFLAKFEQISALKNKITVVSSVVLEKLSTTDSMPEAVAVAQQNNFKLRDIQNAKRIVLLENIKDAGNLGTLIRSACAFSIDAVLLCGDTVDIYNPKVVRSTVGALFKLPVIKTSLQDVKEMFPASVFIATVVNHKNITEPEDIDYKKPFVLMLGAEADGLSNKAIELSDIKTTITISTKTESLNLSTAGSILFYISTR